MRYFLNLFLITLYFFLFCSTFINVLATPTQHLCSPDQRDILLQFKDEFQHDEYCPYWCEDTRNVTDSWDMNGDCCFWDGVTCDNKSGHVIELDLSCGCLYGEINSSSSLFRLRNLSLLNLAYNDFNDSLIPIQFSKLKELRRLSLSKSYFSGQIPMELLHLTKLESLHLSSYYSLSTEKSFFDKLVYNLTNLKELNLESVNIFSEIPLNISNLSSLRSLCLDHCSLIGEIPRNFFLIPTLQSISLQNNTNLKGSLPDFDGNNSLVSLDLSRTSLSGNIPNSISNCKHLTTLILMGCNFRERIPSSIGNLSRLTNLDLFYNNLVGEIPSSLGNLSHLTNLDLSSNNLVGEIPSSLGNLSHLTYLDLFSNNLFGEIPSTLGNSYNLTYLDLSKNNFVGSFPRFISKLVKLESLYLSDFNTQLRPIDLAIFSKLTSLQDLELSNLNTTIIELNALLSPLKSLKELTLSGNHVSPSNITSTSDLPFQLEFLDLSSSSITEFPTFIKTQQRLTNLDLSKNKIKDKVPGWLWNLSSLSDVNLSNNNFSGFDRLANDSSRSPISWLDLTSNNFQGPLFVPPRPIKYLFASKNNFSGEIPRSICAMSFLEILDLSYNNFNGSLPQCLRILIETFLSVLKLDNNHLSGRLPDIFINCFNLRSLNVGHNQFEGKLPRSLKNCSSLEVLNMEHNKFKDVFPLWLVSLQNLQVLVLRSNEFHGSLQYHPPFVASWFPQLRIIDVSSNAFMGILPFDYFIYWSAMFSEGDLFELKYIGGYYSYYQDPTVLMNKGTEMELVRILKTYTALDFSENQFKGEIPRSIGLLKGLRVLNLSNNYFTGQIPSSMANLTALETLDMSRNQLSGGIPQELGTLSYLAYMNFSHNQLVGPIPAGQQFRTQKCSSFQDNPKLYGHVLDEVCNNIHTKKPQHSETPKSEEDIEEMLSWKAVTIGIGPGIVFGMTIGCILFSYKPKWFMKMFNQNKRRNTRRTH